MILTHTQNTHTRNLTAWVLCSCLVKYDVFTVGIAILLAGMHRGLPDTWQTLKCETWSSTLQKEMNNLQSTV